MSCDKSTLSARKMKHKQSLHRRSSIPRLYLPWGQESHGLLSLERLHGKVIRSIECGVGVGIFLFRAASRELPTLGFTFDIRREANLSVTELISGGLNTRIQTAEIIILLKQHVDEPRILQTSRDTQFV